MTVAYFVAPGGRPVIGRSVIDYRAHGLGEDPFDAFAAKVCGGATASIWIVPGTEEP